MHASPPPVLRRVGIAIARCLIALAALGSPAFASPSGPRTEIADPRFSTMSPVIVGAPSGMAAGLAIGPHIPGQSGFVVVARDVNNAPVLGREVVLNFSLTTVHLDAVQDSGCVVDCAAQTLTGNTAAHGWVVFHPRLGGFANQPLVEVSVGGVVIGNVPVRSPDLNGTDLRVGFDDFLRFTAAYLAHADFHPEVDFDDSGGIVGLGDFTIFVREYLSGARGTPCP